MNTHDFKYIKYMKYIKTFEDRDDFEKFDYSDISEYIREEIIYTNNSAIEQYKKLKKAYDYNIKN